MEGQSLISSMSCRILRSWHLDPSKEHDAYTVSAHAPDALICLSLGLAQCVLFSKTVLRDPPPAAWCISRRSRMWFLVSAWRCSPLPASSWMTTAMKSRDPPGKPGSVTLMSWNSSSLTYHPHILNAAESRVPWAGEIMVTVGACCGMASRAGPGRLGAGGVRLR